MISKASIFSIRHKTSLTLYIISWAALLLEWWLVGHTAGGYGQKLSGDILKFLGDGMLILLPFWFIPPRWRWTMLIPVWAGAIFGLVNVWYFRFWGDLLPFDFITMGGNVNADLVKCIPGLWKPEDLLFPAIPAVATAIWAFMRRKTRAEGAFPTTSRLIAVSLTILAFLISQVAYTVTEYRYARANGMNPSWTEEFLLRIKSPIASRFQLLKKCGFTIGTVKGVSILWQSMACKRDLSDEEQQAIDSYLLQMRELNKNGKCSIHDSIAEKNLKKNLILIVVESLNTELLGAEIGGRSVMPVLDSLASANGTLLARQVVPQIKDGGSGDGQMMINTGQLPLRSGSAAILIGDSFNFNSITKRWNGGDNAVIFGDDLNAWNENDTFLNYGFPYVASSRDFKEATARFGGDAAMFSYASRTLPRMQKPFFLELLTVSMHIPFNDPAVAPASWISKGRSKEVAGYLRMSNYFDTELGRFIDVLRREGILENTIIVVTGDHNQPLTDTDDSGYTAFIAANCGLTLEIDHPVGQVDIFPTLMRLTGLWKAGGYNGLGRVMTDPQLTGATSPDGTTHGYLSADEAARQAEAFRISDLMLRDRTRNVKK